MRRHVRLLEDSVRGHESKLLLNTDLSKKVIAQNHEMLNLLKSATCNLLKDTVDIFRYFPAKSNEQIMSFLADDDDFEKRRRAFENHLVCVTEIDPNKGQQFSDALINLLFSKEMIFTKKWPLAE